MVTLKSIARLKQIIKSHRKKGKIIGSVPTMGALHKGHLSLVKQAKKDCDIVVMSIFVNPVQFGPREDFKHYPRDLKRDEKLAKESGVDIIFYPSVRSMYPKGYLTYVSVEDITSRLCGKFRPGHFRGVTTVVNKLFNIVGADIAYFGQKDAQQAIVIQRMVKDLNMDIKIKVLPIVREADGLAMSSRNIYLSVKERRDAKILNFALQRARRMVKSGILNARRIIREMKSLIIDKPTVSKIDYVEIVDLKDLLSLKVIKRKALVAVAVWFGKTRLIDNLIVNGKGN